MATSAAKSVSKSTQKSAPAPGEEDAGQAPRNSRKILFLILGGLLLAAAGGGAWYFFGYAPAQRGPSAAAQSQVPKPPVFLTLEPFTVNLQMEETQQYLQVGMTLQVSNEAQADLFRLYMPQVRSRLLLLLSNKKASEILTVEGKKKLSADIISQLQQPLAAKGQKPEVSDVFFTSFVVQ